MLLYGARFPKIVENAYRNKSLSAIKLWGTAMNNLKVNKRYRIAYSFLTHDDITASGATEEELEGISNFLSNMGDIAMLLFLREDEPGRIKGSIRTARPDINVSSLAKILGGGGHAKASGFTIQGRLEKTDKGYKVI
jgi:phosphoesterase RecJ-like protein